MSANPVVRVDYVPLPPLFPGQDPDEEITGNSRPTNATTSRDIAENSPAGTAIGAPITATDEGADGNQEVLTYTLSDGDSSSYRVDSASGQIRVAPGVTLNHETNPSDEVTLTATDPTDRTSSVTVTINITDINENPVVTGDATHNFEEIDTASLTLGTYNATDVDVGDEASLRWSVSGTDRNIFDITGAGPSAQLSFKERPDYEAPADSGRNNTYELTVVATDTKGGSGTRNVTVAVRNDNEDGEITLSNRGARVGTALTARLSDPDRIIGNVEWTWTFQGHDPVVRSGGSTNTYTPLADHADDALTITADYTDGEAPGQDRYYRKPRSSSRCLYDNYTDIRQSD